MYFGLVAAAGALVGGNPASLIVSLLLVGQYVALVGYNSYRGATA